MARALVWHSSFASLTGYSGSSLAYVLGLAGRGYAVRPLYLYGADHDELLAAGRLDERIRALQRAPLRLDVPQVVYAPGDRFGKNSGAWRIGFTMHEADRLPAAWVEQAQQMDEIWVPTAWGAAVMRDSGITRPITVVPLGIDSARFAGAATPRHDGRVVFVSVFEWGLRKGWDVLLDAWAAAFRADDPVQLVLKIDHRTPLGDPLRSIAERLPTGAAPVGVIYNRALSPAQLTALYRGADCFVLPTRGEGWGMPILEAMACGIPAISTDWGGATAFFDAQCGYPIPLRALVPADAGGHYLRGARWAEPDGAALVELLRRAAGDHAERRRLGLAAARRAAEWTWERAVDVLAARLQALA
ncbi:MAG: glycosyltransferase [Chloroflexi bacterium]|nr:glycosyltransferase [Chloroflexota bacterium]